MLKPQCTCAALERQIILEKRRRQKDSKLGNWLVPVAKYLAKGDFFGLNYYLMQRDIGYTDQVELHKYTASLGWPNVCFSTGGVGLQLYTTTGWVPVAVWQGRGRPPLISLVHTPAGWVNPRGEMAL